VEKLMPLIAKNTRMRLCSLSPSTSQYFCCRLKSPIPFLTIYIIKLRKGWKKNIKLNDLENKYICNSVMGLLVFSCRLFLLHDSSVILQAIGYMCFRRWRLAKPFRRQDHFLEKYQLHVRIYMINNTCN